jgi:hypothetical protein
MITFALCLSLSAPVAVQTPVQRPANTADLSEARRLFHEGGTRYEAADYEGAVEKFTEALTSAKEAGSNDFQVRGLLLYNIGKAHVRAYDTTQDIVHLRQARTIYKQFIKEADTEAMFEHFDPEHVKEARQELRMLEMRIEGLENADQEPLPPPPTSEVDASGPVDQWKRPRNLGIGLASTGSVALVGGVAMLIAGSTFEQNAQDQVNQLADLGVPADHPAWAEGETFVEGEKRRGTTFMAVGGSLAAVGAAGVGVGAYYLAKSKRLQEERVRPSVALSPGYAGIVVSGRF